MHNVEPDSRNLEFAEVVPFDTVATKRRAAFVHAKLPIRHVRGHALAPIAVGCSAADY